MDENKADSDSLAAQERILSLTAINEFFQESLATLSEANTLDLLLKKILQSIVQRLDEKDGRLWLNDAETGIQRIYLNFEESFKPPTVSNHPVMPFIEAGRFSSWRSAVQKDRRPILHLRPGILEESQWGAHHAHYLETGVLAVLIIPLFAGENYLGDVAVRCRKHGDFSEDEVAFCQTLANLAALALQIHRISERSKQAALSQQREQTAQRRVEELSRANQVLAQSLSILNSTQNLSRYLENLLRILLEQMNSASGTLWLCDASNSHSRVEVRLGEPFTDCIVTEREIILEALATMQNRSFGATVHRCGSCDQFRLVVPIHTEDKHLGCFSVDGSSNHWSPEQIELAQALAHQATLALEWDRLSERVRLASLVEERGRMAEEIHDSVAQSFTGILFQIEASTELASTDPKQSLKCLGHAKSLARTGLAEARRAVLALQPESCQWSDLLANLRGLVIQVQSSAKVQAELVVAGSSRNVPADAGMNLIRIAQEAVSNSLRHARANRLKITLKFQPEQIVLSIEDDGLGFLDQPENQIGFGLVNMGRRAERVDAKFILQSAPGAGTLIQVVLPQDASISGD